MESKLPLNKMAVKPIPGLLLGMSAPLMLSMILEALYNVVDSLFIARVSENALTALSLAFPVQLLVVAVTVGTSVGVNAMLSRLLGAGDQEGVNRCAVNGIFVAALTYLAFLFFGLTLVRPYFLWQTDNAEIVSLGCDYLSVCLIWSFGSVGQIMFQRLLQSTGRTTLSMVSQMVGAALNIVLDPLMIFGLCGFPATGVKGAAVATVVGQIAALLIAAAFNFTRNPEVQLSFRHFRPSRKVIAGIYHVGFPAMAMQALNSVMNFGVNWILIRISPTAVAAFGIYIKVQNFVFMPAFGLNNGVIAITAFNYGAGSRRRVDDTIRWGLIDATVILVLGAVLVGVLAEPLLSLFAASAELTAIGARALRVISFSWVFVAFTLIAQGVFQALDNGLDSLIVTLLRVAVILLPALYLFSRLFPLANVWWAFLVSEGGSAIVCLFLFLRLYHRKVAVMGTRELSSRYS